MTGKSNETVDAGDTMSNTGNTTAFLNASTASLGSTATTMISSNRKDPPQQQRVTIPKRSLLDDDDDNEDEDDDDQQEDHSGGIISTPAFAAAPENGRPPLSFKSRFSFSARDQADADAKTQQGTLLDHGHHGSNRRRHSLPTATVGVGTAPPTATAVGTNSNSNITSNHNKHYAWDDFVRQGTRLKTFLDDAMQHVQTNTGKLVGSSSSKRQRDHPNANDNGVGHDDNHHNSDDADDDDSSRPLRRRRVEENDYTAELAREKTEQVMLLQRVSECGTDMDGTTVRTELFVVHRILLIHCGGRHTW
jgi:hypothetical protein